MLEKFTRTLTATTSAKLSLLAALLLTGLLSGCATEKAKATGPIFFPPAPNPPKMQFLKAINGATDIDAKKDSFSLFITGKPDDEKSLEIFKPYGVTVRNKKIYVCDLSGKIVIIDTATKSFQYFTGSGYGGIRKPLNVAFDSADNMYVVDIDRKEVLQFNPSGGFVNAFGKEYNIKPSDVIVIDDEVFVLDLSSNEMKVFNRADGKLLRSLGKTDTQQLLAIPTNFAIDKQGAFRVTNVGASNVVQIDKDGHQLSAFGKLGDGFGEFARPKGIAVDPDGYIYVVDAAHQNVQVFNEAGRLMMFFGGFGDGGGLMNLPAGVAVAPADIPYFQNLVDPSFEAKYLVFVTNQFGKARLSVYAMGKAKGAPDAPSEAPKQPAGDKGEPATGK